MREFIGGGLIKRVDLLKGKSASLSLLAENFLKGHRFWTEWGTNQINILLAKCGIENNDDSVLAFAQSVVGECVAILCFQTGEDSYVFNIVSGSEDEIMRMGKDDDNAIGCSDIGFE